MGTNVSSSRYVSCSLVRYCANRQFYWSVFAVLALTALFAVLDVQTISSTVSIAADGAIRSADSLDPDPAHIVSDAVLASPYQTSIILIPIIMALNVAAGFRTGDERQLRLLVNRPWPFAIGDVLATVIYCAGVSLLSSALNAAILAATLNPALRPMFLTTTVVTTPLRVMVFAVVMGLVGYIAAVATKRDVPALVVIFLLLMVSLSGVLKAIHADVLLPMIGGKSFAFGRVDEAGDLPVNVSAIVMACWLTVTFCAAATIRGRLLRRLQA
ncbi:MULTISPECIES: hypothetical protein [Bifidobacterium]|uniref:hypothetical protein n=1 Tax=Bifidobacterium TaxID=1678 RepID=UPI001BDBBE17|nr:MULTISPECIES: hypothetical protein [Bifidobacterium]MBT1161647.1 hypothetical protein [Bifidobacterium sp. SO1]MBW3078739.1 hypothetical protein [Bifidobacterium simiiventris]